MWGCVSCTRPWVSRYSSELVYKRTAAAVVLLIDVVQFSMQVYVHLARIVHNLLLPQSLHFDLVIAAISRTHCKGAMPIQYSIRTLLKLLNLKDKLINSQKDTAKLMDNTTNLVNDVDQMISDVRLSLDCKAEHGYKKYWKARQYWRAHKNIKKMYPPAGTHCIKHYISWN